MAKIKSTLDLVMERTRNLTMTEREREALKRNEWTDRARGWVQGLLDNKFTPGELKACLEKGSSEFAALGEVLRNELLARIDPDIDNSVLLQALTYVLGLDVKPLAESIDAYRRRYESDRQEHLRRVLSDFILEGISGSAVVPNTDHDPLWIATARRLKDDFHQGVQDLYRYLNQ